MKVIINNTAIDLPEGATLAQALEARSLPSSGIATAVNGIVVPAKTRMLHRLQEGDTVVVIKAFYGG